MPGTPEATPAKQVSDAPSPRRLLSSEKVYEGRIWDVVSDTFQLSESGDALTRDYIDHLAMIRARGQVDTLITHLQEPASTPATS